MRFLKLSALIMTITLASILVQAADRPDRVNPPGGLDQFGMSLTEFHIQMSRYYLDVLENDLGFKEDDLIKDSKEQLTSILEEAKKSDDFEKAQSALVRGLSVTLRERTQAEIQRIILNIELTQDNIASVELELANNSIALRNFQRNQLASQREITHLESSLALSKQLARAHADIYWSTEEIYRTRISVIDSMTKVINLILEKANVAQRRTLVKFKETLGMQRQKEFETFIKNTSEITLKIQSENQKIRLTKEKISNRAAAQSAGGIEPQLVKSELEFEKSALEQRWILLKEELELTESILERVPEELVERADAQLKHRQSTLSGQTTGPL